ncbi:MAG TPA: hypothetical protein VJR05_09315, partial [Acidimicrobiia bacterium]|nr:hypothetical protein [Acidimicrobiia bacterium]
WTRRRGRIWLSAVGAAAGLGFLVWFNWRTLGDAAIAGGYSQTGQITFPNADLAQWGRNILGGLFDVRRGLILSPFLIALAPGIPQAWKGAPPWVRGAALGGVAYFLIQYNAHHFYGGDRFFGYRYQLEALVACGPLLFLSFQTWVRVGGLRQLLFWIGVGVSVGLQAYGATHPYSF